MPKTSICGLQTQWNFSFFPFKCLGLSSVNWKLKAGVLVFHVGLSWGLRARTIGTGRGGPREMTHSFSFIPRAREAVGGGHKRRCGGVGGQDFRELQFPFYQWLYFLFPMGGTLKQSGMVVKCRICRVLVVNVWSRELPLPPPLPFFLHSFSLLHAPTLPCFLQSSDLNCYLLCKGF